MLSTWSKRYRKISQAILAFVALGVSHAAPTLSPADQLSILLAERTYEDARAAAEDILAGDPHDARAWVSLIRSLVRLDRADEARLRIDAFAPEDAMTQLGRGTIAALDRERALAESLYTAAAVGFAHEGNPHGLLVAYEGLGISLDESGQYDDAIPVLSKAAALADSLQLPAAKRVTHHALGQLLGDVGRYEEATEHLQQAISESELLGANRWIGQAHLTLSTVYRRQMELDLALGHRVTALAAYEAAGDALGQARSHRLIGVIHLFKGEFTRAIARLERAKSMAVEADNPREIGICLGDLGSINYMIGDYDRAIPLFEEAVRVGRDVFVVRRTGAIIGNIATALTDLGRYDEALVRFEDALAIVESGPSAQGAQQILNNMGRCLCEQGRFAEGIDRLEAATRSAAEWGDIRVGAAAARDIARCRLAEGDLDAAEDALAVAAERAEAIGYYNTILSVRQTQALLARERGQLKDASRLIAEAVELAEGVRLRSQGSSAVQAQVFGHMGEIYDVAVELLYAQHVQDPSGGHGVDAFELVQRAKARAFLDLLVETETDLRFRADPTYHSREQELLSRVAELLTERTKSDLDVSARIDADIANLEQSLSVLEGEIRAGDPRYAELNYPVPLTLTQVQDTVLAEGEVFLDYLLGDRSSFVLAVTRSSFEIAELPPRSDIERDVRALLPMMSDYNVLGENAAYFVEPASRLSAALIGPVIETIRAASRIIVSPDGVLHYVPFEALLTETVTPDDPDVRFDDLPFLLLSTQAISRTPSVSALARLRRDRSENGPPDEQGMLLVGDPTVPTTGGGSAFTRTVRGETFGPVPGAEREIDAIRGIYRPGSVRLLVGPHAAPANLRDAAAEGPYRFVHIVAHGVFNERRPQYSGLALSADEATGHDGFFSVGDVFALDMPCGQVVLSACSSALGENVSGEGLVGLTRGFLYAGARSVVAALWEVSGQATATSMTAYYERARNVSDDELAIALAEAKRSVLRTGRVEIGGRTTSMAHPFFWAAFVLIGDG